MPVQYDDETGGFAIVSTTCECGADLYDTGCDAPGCNGYTCMDCGTGCDIEVEPEDGRCATALEAESDDERDERFNRERAVFGLSPLGNEAG